jgi:hypothetical protein
MATWKKVLVSGSSIVINQVNVGDAAGVTQQITGLQTTTRLSGSFSGSGMDLTINSFKRTGQRSGDAAITGSLVLTGNISASGTGSFSVIETPYGINFTDDNHSNQGAKIYYDNQEGDKIIFQAGTRNLLEIQNPFIGSTGEVVVNEDSLLVNFRVESADNAHMLFVAAQDNSVGIGVRPTASLHVAGNIWATTNITASANISASGLLFISASQTLGETYGVLVRDPATGRVYHTGSYNAGGVTAASIFNTISGDVLVDASGVATIQANSVALGTDTTGNYVATIDPGAGLTGGSTSGEGVAHTLAVGAGNYITVNANDVAVNTTTLTPAISGSIFTQINGDVTITAGGASAIGTGVIVNADVNAAAAIEASKINFLGTSFVSASTLAAGSGQGSTTLTTNGVSSGDITATGLGTAGTPTFAGATLTGNLAINNSTSTAITTTGTTAAVFNTTATTVNAFGAATTLNLGTTTGTTTIKSPTVVGTQTTQAVFNTAATTVNAFGAATAITMGATPTSTITLRGATLVGNAATQAVFNTTATTVNAFGAATTLNLGAATGTTKIANNLAVTGDLTVNGNLTTINTTNLAVEDKFILLASGSATAGDGGIIIDRGSDVAYNIGYGYDSATGRWGYQNLLQDTTTALDPTSGNGVNGSFAGYVFTEASHTATKPTTGEFAQLGSIYTANSGDIFIFS